MKKRVLYFYPRHSSFVASDRELLSRHFKVFPFLFQPRYKLFTPLTLLQELFFLVQYFRPGTTLISQFSGYHSFLPSVFSKLFNRPHYIILHGTECNNFPEYEYGFKSRPLLYWFSKQSLALATRLLPVSEALVFQEYSFAEVRYRTQGIKAFYPGISTPISVIHNGINPDKFFISGETPRENNSFVTIATGLENLNRRGLKGLDFIIDVAGRCPQYRFIFIGGMLKDQNTLPSNIEFKGHVDNDELFKVLNRHPFYLQWSVSEGFGISVVEAMMCGCVPVVSNVGILPQIAGPSGYVLEVKDPDKAVALLEKAVNEYSDARSFEARHWAIEHYRLELRSAALYDVVCSEA